MFFIHVLTTLTVGLWVVIEGTKEWIETYINWRNKRNEDKYDSKEHYKTSGNRPFHLPDDDSDKWKYL